jgi:hypothetical protein
LRADALAALLRAGDLACADFFVARDLAAAREAGLFDFFLAISASPPLSESKAITNEAS